MIALLLALLSTLCGGGIHAATGVQAASPAAIHATAPKINPLTGHPLAG